MKLLKIQENLNQKRYVTQIHNSIKSLTIALPDEDGNPKIGTTSRVEIKDDSFVFIYYSAQVPMENKFTQEKELLEFIFLKFPIE